VKITVVHPGELGPPELARWRELQQAVPGMDDPFMSGEFAVAVGRVLDRARVAVLEDPAEGIVGFFPFERRALGVGQGLAAELRGGQGLVHAPGLELDPRALLRACGLVVWEFTDLLPNQALFERHQVLRSPCPIIDLSGGYDRYLAERRRQSRSLVKNVELKVRRMTRDLGPVRFAWDVHDPGDLRLLMRWKSAQYRRTGRTDRFAMPWIVRLVEDLVETRTEACSGVLSMLYAGDRPVAGHFGLAGGPVLTYKFPAYDADVGYYSPGLILNLRLAEAAAAAGLREINLGPGDFDYKQRFKSHDVMMGEGRVARPSVRAGIRWVRSEPIRHFTHLVVSTPGLRHAADLTLKRIGQLRTALRRDDTAGSPPQEPPGRPRLVVTAADEATGRPQR
jgi:CelD/BcsL family acetyltransferase involved in cellulose biosynthesis